MVAVGSSFLPIPLQRLHDDRNWQVPGIVRGSDQWVGFESPTEAPQKCLKHFPPSTSHPDSSVLSRVDLRLSPSPVSPPCIQIYLSWLDRLGGSFVLANPTSVRLAQLRQPQTSGAVCRLSLIPILSPLAVRCTLGPSLILLSTNPEPNAPTPARFPRATAPRGPVTFTSGMRHTIVPNVSSRAHTPSSPSLQPHGRLSRT